MYYEPDIFCVLSVSFEVYCFYLRICLTVLVLVLVLVWFWFWFWFGFGFVFCLSEFMLCSILWIVCWCTHLVGVCVCAQKLNAY